MLTGKFLKDNTDMKKIKKQALDILKNNNIEVATDIALLDKDDFSYSIAMNESSDEIIIGLDFYSASEKEQVTMLVFTYLLSTISKEQRNTKNMDDYETQVTNLAINFTVIDKMNNFKEKMNYVNNYIRKEQFNIYEELNFGGYIEKLTTNFKDLESLNNALT